MRELFPPIQPYNVGFLEVGNLHRVYFEECGNPKGVPVLFLHGGPGSGCEEKHRCFFDPKFFRIILMDQRGAGRSLPYASTEENTTWDLVSDIEVVRKRLGIEKWILFGGSWGSTLALSYGVKHSERVSAMILRGIFLGRKQDINWLYQEGASRIFPEEWEKYLQPLTQEERKNPLHAYYKIFSSKESKRKNEAASAWIRWEGAALRLKFDAETFANFTSDHRAMAFSCIESHYFYHDCFFPEENFLIKNSGALQNIPCTIIHGRYDIICPVDNAWELKKALPKAKLFIVPDAGHSGSEPGILEALLEATEAIKRDRTLPQASI